MPALNVIIVDDEEFARSSLFFLLQENCEQVHICGIAQSVAEARLLLAKFEVDLIFLDIAMPGKNGFELIPDAKNNHAQVVFTTAYDQYALKAIKASALDYLLKPIDIEELKETVEKAVKFIELNDILEERNERMSTLNEVMNAKSEIRKLSLPNNQGYTLISIDDIIHIEADSNYCIFHLQNREKITVSKILKDYEEILPENQFVRIHKSSILNLDYLKEFNSKNGLEVVLKNGDKIAVSRRRASDFMEKIRLYTRRSSDK